MKIHRGFDGDTDRYAFDFVLCSYAQGFAQFDTRQDASYFGTWISPAKRQLVNYAEGDITVTTCETDEEFVREAREFVRWNDEHGWGPARIDPGFGEEMKTAFARLGLTDILH